MALSSWSLRGRRLSPRQVYAISVGLIAVGLVTPWVVRWSGWLRGEAPAVVETAKPREPRVRELRPVMLELPGGRFMMGSPENEEGRDDDEGPQREVAISRFEMCQTEVTQENYEAVMGTNPSLCEYGCDPDMPVQNVSWFDAIRYLNRLTAIENEFRPDDQKMIACYEQRNEEWVWRPGCTGYRLPTEAEWEYAARARRQTRYYFGDDDSELGEYAWYLANAGDMVHTVGSTPKSHPWHLRDMYGNVWEWIWDWYAPYQAAGSVVRDPTGPIPGDPMIPRSEGEPTRVVRGGGFGLYTRFLRSAMRGGFRPRISGKNCGFRCVRDVVGR